MLYHHSAAGGILGKMYLAKADAEEVSKLRDAIQQHLLDLEQQMNELNARLSEMYAEEGLSAGVVQLQRK